MIIGQSPSIKSLTYDPLERFPYEIWQDCFQLAIYDTVYGPLPYLAVSTKWNETILHDPAFWTKIIIDDGEDQDARIYTFLYLSQPRLIDVEYRANNGFPRVMEGYSPRIRSIKDSATIFNTNSPGNLWTTLDPERARDDIPSFPEIKTLIGMSHHTLSRSFVLACPNLKIIRSIGVNISYEPCLSSTIQEATFSEVRPDNLLKIKGYGHIRSLALRSPLWLTAGDEQERRTSIAAWSTSLKLLATTIVPQLESLRIQLPLDSFWGLIQALSHFSQLRTLILDLILDRTILKDHSISPLHLQRLKSLTLNFDSYGVATRSESTSRQIDAVLHSFVKEDPLQNLEDLQVFSFIPCDASLLGSLLQSAINAESINVRVNALNIAFSDDIPPIKPNLKLKVLSLYPPSLLNYYDVPNLVELKITGLTRADILPRINFRLGLQIIKLDVPGWIFDTSHIASSQETPIRKHRYVKLSSKMSPGILNQFSRLEEIHLNSGGPFRAIDREVTDSLLVELLRSDGICPRLYTIRFRAFPRWEPLFEMMRQRITQTVQQITCLGFPVLPHIYLLRRLVQLLGGTSTVHTTRNVDEIIYRRRSCGIL